MSRLPFMQFYPSDWIQDTRRLSLEARGAWIDLLCAMWIAPERGKLEWSYQELQNFLGLRVGPDSTLNAETLLDELVSVADIGLRDGVGNVVRSYVDALEVTIISRRMVREEAKRKQANSRQSRHRHAPVTQESRRIFQKSEVRSHTSEEDKSKSAASGFESFWQAYPKKKAKGDAEKAWRSLKPDADLVASILAAVELQSHSQEWNKDAGQFVPYPASWLRAKRWQDGGDTPEPVRRVPLVAVGNNGQEKPLPRAEQQARLKALVGNIGRV